MCYHFYDVRRDGTQKKLLIYSNKNYTSKSPIEHHHNKQTIVDNDDKSRRRIEKFSHQTNF